MSKSTFPEEENFHSGLVFDFFKPRSPSFSELYDWGPSMTRQEFADDCDINTIMKRYEATGQLPQGSVAPHYADYSSVPNLMEALDLMTHAQSEFMRLPAAIRKTFDNDPLAFVEFASNPEGLDEASGLSHLELLRRWGMANPAPQEPPEVAPASAPASGPAPSASPPGGDPKPV